MERYSYLLNELLLRNTQLHGSALKQRGNNAEWPDVTIDVARKELRCNINRRDTKLKAKSGQIWGWLRNNDISTRQIYQLLLQWALHLTEMGILYTYTDKYRDLLEELKYVIETGADGDVEDIPPEEIIAEWKFMQENYYSFLHNLCVKLIGED